MANRQLYQLTTRTLALSDVFESQDAAGSVETGKSNFSALKTVLSLENVDDTSDANKPVSTAQQAALDLKADVASPTFTGTVSGITSSMVGLGNVDNTSDVNKPVSTLQAASIATKQATLVSGTNIKTVGGSSLVGSGNVVVPITVKVTISSAQILALFTTPITLVAAQGAGTFINVLSVHMRLTYGTATYATNTGSRVSQGSFLPIVTDQTILAGTQTTFLAISPTQSLAITGTADWVNVPLKISALVGNPTTGDSTLDVYTTYNVITL